MAVLTKLNIVERDKDNVLSINCSVNVARDGLFTTTLSKEDVNKIHEYGIKLPKNRVGNEGYFSDNTLSGLEDQLHKILKECFSFNIIEEKPVIRYQIEISCLYSLDKNFKIVPNPTLDWTGLDHEKGECEWISGTKRIDAVQKSCFGIQVYAKPFLKQTGRYASGKDRIEYKPMEAEKGSNVDWLNCLTCIAPVDNRSRMKEVECTEKTAMVFVEMIKSICKINEQIKDLINPDGIRRIGENIWLMLND